MPESFEGMPISEQVVIEALNSYEIGDPRALELLGKFVDQCHVDADREADADQGNPVASNRANIKAEIRIARLYLKTEKYREEAIGSLEEAHNAASQDDSTQDLALEIEELFSEFE